MDDLDVQPNWASPSPGNDNMASTQDEESQPVLSDRPPTITATSSVVSNATPVSSSRTFIHRLFRLYKFVTMATAFFLLVAQVVSVAYLPADEVEMIIKLFISSFCVLIILNELERWKMLSDSPFFSNWVPRGYFYAFIGIVSIEENNLKSSTADYSFATLTSSYSAIMFIEVTSWMMFALGVFFIFFGLCCCQRYHAKVREEYTNRMAERKRMFGESGLRSNSFDVPMKRWDDSKGTMT